MRFLAMLNHPAFSESCKRKWHAPIHCLFKPLFSPQRDAVSHLV